MLGNVTHLGKTVNQLAVIILHLKLLLIQLIIPRHPNQEPAPDLPHLPKGQPPATPTGVALANTSRPGSQAISDRSISIDLQEIGSIDYVHVIYYKLGTNKLSGWTCQETIDQQNHPLVKSLKPLVLDLVNLLGIYVCCRGSQSISISPVFNIYILYILLI